MKHPEQQYLDILKELTTLTKSKSDPHGVGSVAVLGRQMRFDLSSGEFPLLTTKKIKFEFVAHELLWFLRGDRTIDYLKENKVPIWDPWATKEVSESMGYKEGDVGPIYGPQWIHWKNPDGTEINQIQKLVDGIKEHPDWRRHMVTSWNPSFIDKVFVAPCHGIFHCFVMDGKLSLHMFQRSADFFIGVPYNIASYSLLLLMLAQVTGLEPGEFVHTTSDTHLYLNHFEAAREQLSREPRPFPKLKLNPSVKNIFDFTIKDFELVEYDPHPHIKADVAV